MYAQAYFDYDSKKSGGVTMSHLRFGKNQISPEENVCTDKAGIRNVWCNIVSKCVQIIVFPRHVVHQHELFDAVGIIFCRTLIECGQYLGAVADIPIVARL